LIDVLIIGSGPAGLSAAIYTTRAGLSTTVFEGELAGGLVTTTERIDNYLGMPETLGTDMAETFRNHARSFGANLLTIEIDSIQIVEATDSVERHFLTTTKRNETVPSRSVIFAAGSTPRKLGAKGENLSGVSYCAICDGLFFSGDAVAVVGGGESAVEEALYLAQIASSVDVLVRGSEWRASAAAVARLEAHPAVTIHMSTSVDEIVGDSEVDSIKLSNGSELEVQGVFISIGQDPNSSTAGDNVTLYADGFIEKSDVEGFFVAGDISTPEYRQVVIAAGEGAKAGIDATTYLLSK
jgi:thioredoxin reductase (NADPH)